MKQSSVFSVRKRFMTEKRIQIQILSLLSFILLMVSGCAPEKSTVATVNLSAGIPSESISSIGEPNYNALGTFDDVDFVTVKIINTSNNFIVKGETEMSESTTDAKDWSITFSDIPIDTELKFTAKAYNSGSIAIFEGDTIRTFTAAEPTVDLALPMASIDDGTQPNNPVIVSASIPNAVYVSSIGNVLVFDVSHDSDFYYEVSSTSGGTITSPASGTHTPGSDLAVAYTAPSSAGTDTVTLKVWDTDSVSDVISASYPIDVVVEPVSSISQTVLFGPCITAIAFNRATDALRATVEVDASTDITYAWSGTDSFSDVSSDTNPLEISTYFDTDSGTLTVSVTDENGIQTSLTRPMIAGAYDFTITARPEPERSLPDTNQFTSATSTLGEDSNYGEPHYFTDNGNGTVTDNKTLLVWQQVDDNVTRTWDDAITYCADATFDGLTNWRLPYVKELQSIADYGHANPAVDASVFPTTNASDFWTYTPVNSSADYAWAVDFYYGEVDIALKATPAYVRCVSSDSSDDLWAGDFIIVNNETAYHPDTRLTWQREDVNEDDNTKDEAIDYCYDLEFGGFTDWRLPNIRELQSIMDYTTRSPSINTTIFRNTDSYPAVDANGEGSESGSIGFWSSTSTKGINSRGFYINTWLGQVTELAGSLGDYRRTLCVRGGDDTWIAEP